jgi:hypothetical protein
METIFEQFLTPAKRPSGEETAITVAVPLPSPRCDVNVRLAAPGTEDLAFIDALQKMHSHMVGFMPKKQLEKYVADGHVLIAEDMYPSRARQEAVPALMIRATMRFERRTRSLTVAARFIASAVGYVHCSQDQVPQAR